MQLSYFLADASPWQADSCHSYQIGLPEQSQSVKFERISDLCYNSA
ncbi:MAG: hypothetical protein RID53_13955 [Coleofasciculus sp. B1-GNL1-01]